jgi:hypothetical protein
VVLLIFIILLRLLSVVLYLLTQFHSCHSNIAVYAPAISITTAAAAAAAATTAFIPLLPAENAGCQMLLLERLCFAARWRIFCSSAAVLLLLLLRTLGFLAFWCCRCSQCSSACETFVLPPPRNRARVPDSVAASCSVARKTVQP